eukprot:Em0011g787a
MSLSHAQRVTRLYRNAQKHLLSWTVDRQAWRQEAVILRAKFDAHKDLKDIARAAQLLEEGEREFERRKHPDPYISPEAPEGSKWERNMAPPPHVLEMLPIEKQWYEEALKYGYK